MATHLRDRLERVAALLTAAQDQLRDLEAEVAGLGDELESSPGATAGPDGGSPAPGDAVAGGPAGCEPAQCSACQGDGEGPLLRALATGGASVSGSCLVCLGTGTEAG